MKVEGEDAQRGAVTVSESSCRPGGQLLWTWLRNSAGDEIATTYHEYDAIGRQTRAVTWRASDGVMLWDLRWEYDSLDRVVKIRYWHLGVIIDLGYNLRGEVTSEVTTGNGSGQVPPPYTNQYGGTPTGNVSAPSNEAWAIPGAVMSVPNRSASYDYDQAGNRTSQTIDGVTTTLAYNSASRLTTESRSGWSRSHVYDGRGNETTRTTVSGGATTVETFGYNYQNLMSSYVRTVGATTQANWQYDYWPTAERYAKTNLLTSAGSCTRRTGTTWWRTTLSVQEASPCRTRTGRGWGWTRRACGSRRREAGSTTWETWWGRWARRSWTTGAWRSSACATSGATPSPATRMTSGTAYRRDDRLKYYATLLSLRIGSLLSLPWYCLMGSARSICRIGGELHTK